VRRSLVVILSTALLSLSSMAVAGVASAATIAATTTCSNGVDDTPGLGLICEVTIVNSFTPSGGTANVTVRECHGAAGDPTAACSTRTTVLTRPVTTVNQCNYATNGGGSTLRCSVKVTNAFIGVSAGAIGVSVDQCVGSGDGIANSCDPFPATTSGAAITQCNGSANGGTLVGLICTATGTASSGHRVTINQCNNSANGGGSLVICSAAIASRVLSAGASPTPGTRGSSQGPALGGPRVLPTGPPSDLSAARTFESGGPDLTVVVGLLGLIALVTLAAVRRFGETPRTR
jgi:hypothetical protein